MSNGPTIEYYWRPGCPFCMRLESKLARHDLPLERRNIWDDERHAATVRSVANGNETVPTVIIGDHALVNPSADEVLRVLQRESPHLVPADWEPSTGTRIGQTLGRLFRE
ncbi:MAG: NrdH-redoxin [Acidimicrobiia bacterium]|nr:NrdH-redoxin [Acidimicrobiia bacterium]MDH5236079.1 NrdH-redoxin [Acidimicrobiia bacterium]